MKNSWHEPRLRKLEDIYQYKMHLASLPPVKNIVPRKRREKLTGLNHVYKCPLQHSTFPVIIN